ncbi:MAG TPA: DUF2784 family protein [Spirochaetota bacterium]|nr:DUF2784 family protein [Spirochaetota bacterium]OQA99615.1 MAG: hypothetical protein BWY23_00581 [Spirochaetes bacterium ADurb.Bin218]HON15006.1 DUF2784 family protein [Spirochaetota bacterium]HOQ11154.1 DUF2784 family protein [Spirochaetota bacterium]HOV09301.1 DUF2784 family protein [Spirochaetota bacterium]
MENKILLHILDYFFIIFHTLWTLFNMVGWIWEKTRPLHLFTVSATALSWFVLGYFYGWGYCLCTDWHWQIRESLGKMPKSNSFIHFVIIENFGFKISPEIIDLTVLLTFIFLLLMSVILNLRDRKFR